MWMKRSRAKTAQGLDPIKKDRLDRIAQPHLREIQREMVATGGTLRFSRNPGQEEKTTR
jgi:hypothetical protein